MITREKDSTLRLAWKPVKRSLYVCARVMIACLLAATIAAQTANEAPGASAPIPLPSEPPATIVVDPPLSEAPLRGTVVIRHHTEHLRLVPVFGAAALAISPRVGHVHVSVDDASWVWADASGEPVTIFGLAPGPHKVRIRLVNANHQKLDEGAVTFIVPEARIAATIDVHAAEAIPRPPQHQPPVRIVDAQPLPEPLSRGVVLIRYRTENLDVVPLFGPAATAVPPRIGHIRVTVDDAPWHWIDTSGNPVIVQGLAPGVHKILIELANANHELIDRKTIEVTVPAAKVNGG